MKDNHKAKLEKKLYELKAREDIKKLEKEGEEFLRELSLILGEPVILVCDIDKKQIHSPATHDSNINFQHLDVGSDIDDQVVFKFFENWFMNDTSQSFLFHYNYSVSDNVWIKIRRQLILENIEKLIYPLLMLYSTILGCESKSFISCFEFEGDVKYCLGKIDNAKTIYFK